MPGAFHGSNYTQELEPMQPSAIFPIPVVPPEPLVQTTISTSDLTLASPAMMSPISLNTPTTATYEESSLPAVTKRARGPKTTLRFAHPAPPTRPLAKHGLLRPKILLQLQQRRESGFHRPLYDVLPANRFAPRTKIAQKLHRLQRRKDGREADDLVVINAEDYSVSDTNSEEIEIADSRALVGVISPTFSATVATTVAEFTLENTIWCIKAGLNGASYTLESQCDTPQIARWYIPKRKRNSVIVGGSAAPAAQEGRKFYFTTILPDSKQHPIIASMTEVSLEVNDSYTVTSREEEIVTDESTRKLIIISAAWVFFMEGWSNNYRIKPKNNSCSKPPHARANSLPVEPTRRRSIFTQSPSRSPSLQPTPIEGLSCSSSSRSSEAPPPAPRRLPGAFCLSDAGLEHDQAESRVSVAKVNVDPQGSGDSQIIPSDVPSRVQQADPQLIPTTPTEATASLRARAPGPGVVLRARDMSNNDEKAKKRRSWGHLELRPRASSLARSMSNRLKRDRPIILTADSVQDIPIASIEERSSSPHTGVRHFRRISQRLRPLNLGKPDAIDFTAEALRPFTPQRQSSAPTTRPTTAKSLAVSETITFDNTSPYNALPKADFDFAEKDSRESLPRPAQLPVTMDGSMSAAQSTDTLPDPGQVSWWQQYDQFVERHCSPVAERYSLEQIQRRSQETSQEYSQEPLQVHSPEQCQEKSHECLQVHTQEKSQEIKTPLVEVPDEKISSSTDMESHIRGVELPAAGSKRSSLSAWKGKLRSKLHV